MQLFNQAQELYGQGPPQAYGTPQYDEEGNLIPGSDAPLTPGSNANLDASQGGIGELAGGNIEQNQNIQGQLEGLAGSQNPGQQLGESLTGGIQEGIGAQLGAGDNPLTGQALGQQGNVAGAYGDIFGQQLQQYDPGQTQGGQTDVSGALGQQLAGGGGQNPYLDQLVQGAAQGQINSFNRNVLPGIRTEAQGAGQIGGTRQGIAEGIAGGDLAQSIGNTSANIYGNAFNTQAGLQGQAVQNVLGAQTADQAAGLQGAGLNNQNYQQYIQSLLQGTGQQGQQLGQGLGLGYDAIGTGTAQAGNLFGQGNSLQLQQQLQSLGMIPGFQAGSLSQLGAQNQLGLQQYGLGQNNIDALMNQYYFNQNSPYNLLSQYQQYISGPYGSTVPGYGGYGGGGGGNQYPTYQH
jgi:hypothetical protein